MSDLIERQDVYDVLIKEFQDTDGLFLAGRLSAAVHMIPKVVDKNCGECSRRGWYQKGYADGKREVCEDIVRQLEVWEVTSLDSIEECAFKKAIGIVRIEGDIE